MFNDIQSTITQPEIEYRGVSISIKRLDLIHPQISGNKYYKLKYNFLEAQRLGYRGILTFGGAYSNHIAATAYAAHRYGFKSVGIIRGEELKHRALNWTLSTAHAMGMQLEFISRNAYREKHLEASLQQFSLQFPDYYIIPEGGTNRLAIKGCTEILSDEDRVQFDVICCAVGTGGTITGLIESSHPDQTIIGFSALKGEFLTEDVRKKTAKTHWHITDEFCFGGYAKTSPALFEFIEHFEQQYQIPLEQIYTAKMLYGIFKWIDQGYFKKNQRLLMIHSGGLQGKQQ